LTDPGDADETDVRMTCAGAAHGGGPHGELSGNPLEELLLSHLPRNFSLSNMSDLHHDLSALPGTSRSHPSHARIDTYSQN
jgi:hypothetical protein